MFPDWQRTGYICAGKRSRKQTRSVFVIIELTKQFWGEMERSKSTTSLKGVIAVKLEPDSTEHLWRTSWCVCVWGGGGGGEGGWGRWCPGVHISWRNAHNVIIFLSYFNNNDNNNNNINNDNINNNSNNNYYNKNNNRYDKMIIIVNCDYYSYDCYYHHYYNCYHYRL